MLSIAATIEVSVVYLQCSVPCHVNLLARTVFENICFPFFLLKLTSISRQNWSCEEIPSSENSDKAASFPTVVVNENIMKVNYSKSLRNKITLFTHHEVLSYLQNHQLWDILVDLKKFLLWNLAKHPVHDSDFVLLYIHRLARWILRHSSR